MAKPNKNAFQNIRHGKFYEEEDEDLDRVIEENYEVEYEEKRRRSGNKLEETRQPVVPFRRFLSRKDAVMRQNENDR